MLEGDPVTKEYKGIWIVCGDIMYEVNDAYRCGALAMRSQTPYYCNPYTDDSYEADQWNVGHFNEAGGEHIRFGVDIIKENSNKNIIFEEDPNVPRDRDGNVDWGWYEQVLLKFVIEEAK